MACIGAAVLLITAAYAPSGAQQDPRITEYSYDPDAVYELPISQGQASVILLEDDEVVESIVVGDSSNWSVEATASANRIVVKPLAAASATNMVVLTTKRTYTFTLSSFGGTDIFVMRFQYALPTSLAGERARYRLRGDRELFPRLITDNGQSTSIFWEPGTSFPGVFVVDEEGDVIAADYRPAGDGLVVEGIHDQIIFRSGDASASAKRREVKAR